MGKQVRGSCYSCPHIRGYGKFVCNAYPNLRGNPRLIPCNDNGCPKAIPPKWCPRRNACEGCRAFEWRDGTGYCTNYEREIKVGQTRLVRPKWCELYSRKLRRER